MTRLRIGLLVLVACLWASPGFGAGTTLKKANAQYRRAIEDARAGRTGPALESLRELVNLLPNRQDIFGDYVVVLGWAGKHAAAVNLIYRINRAQAPTYVIEALAGSARRVGSFDLSESLYRQAMARSPGRLEPQIGLVLTLVGAGKIDEASALADRLRNQAPRRGDVLEAYAVAATARHAYIDALTAYQAMPDEDPYRRIALRGRIFSLGRMGAPQLAVELADRNPGAIDESERGALSAGGTANTIRWGEIAADIQKGPLRLVALDRALAESEEAGTRALDPAAVLSDTDRTLALDRIAALRARFRMQEAVTLYETMDERKAEMPAYSKAAAASAYLYLEQPERARDLYREALVTDPMHTDSRIGLFYALAENEEYPAALEHIENVVETTPSLMDSWSGDTQQDNPAYVRVLSARAMAPTYANRPDEAQRRLQELSDQAPFNMDVRTSLASSMRANGHPRIAEEELRWVLAAEPDNGGALAEHAGALLEMRDYRAAESELAVAQAANPEDSRTKRAARLWEVHNMNELRVESTVTRADGGPQGDRDLAIESWLYSSPMAYQYRAFLHYLNSEAEFDTGTTRHERAGAGLEYRSVLVVASGEISQDWEGGETGVATNVAVSPDDFWTFRGRLDSAASDIPLNARQDGVTAWSGGVGADWRADVSRSASVSLDHFEFSDGNRRDVAQARWTERVVAGPVYRLEISPTMYASANSLRDAPYYNPEHDFSPTVEFSNEWLLWRRYTCSFRHRVIGALGSYSQQGYATRPVAGIRYEQEWEAYDRFGLRYGVGRNRHPYDGVQNSSDFAFLSLTWRF